jgi:hypothetical protein
MASRQPTEGIEDSGSLATDEVKLVEAALRFGHRRELILGNAFANPAWEIMLRLYAAAAKGHDVSNDALMAATGRSKVTQRWLDALVQDGLVAISSPSGIPLVKLTTHGKASMDALFASAQAGTAVS